MPENDTRSVLLEPYEGGVRREFRVIDEETHVLGLLRARMGSFMAQEALVVYVEFFDPLTAEVVYRPKTSTSADKFLGNDKSARRAVRNGLIGLNEILGYKPY